MFYALEEKFVKARYNKAHILKSLSSFEDADSEPMPKMLVHVSWDEVKSYINMTTKEFIS